MRRIALPPIVFAAVLAVTTVAAAPPPAAPPPAVPAAPAVPVAPLDNFDLSQGEVGQAPPGWGLPSASRDKGYSAVVVAEHPEGAPGAARAVMLAAPAAPAAALPAPPAAPPAAAAQERRDFGTVMRAFDAAPYRGQRVRFQAQVRLDGGATPAATAAPAAAPAPGAEAGPPPPQAQLWLRIDLPNGRRGFFDNMADRPVRSASWGRYEVVGDVAPDATTVNLGLLLSGSGSRAYLSAPRFEVLGPTARFVEAARPLSDAGVANLAALARLAGVVRYFHPSDQAAAADWFRVVLAGVQKVEGAAAPADLAHTLETVFLPIAPTVRVFPAGRPAAVPAELLAAPQGHGKVRVLGWRHLGVGAGMDIANGVYTSERVDVALPQTDPNGKPLALDALDWPPPAKPLVVELGGGVSAAVPLTLYAGDQGTLPEVPAGVLPPAPDKPDGFFASGDDRATRLADVILAWNVLQHFYPYFDITGTDWPAELRRALRAAATDRDAPAFRDTLNRMVAALHDGHGRVHLLSDAPAALHLPLSWSWVEGQLVVTAVDAAHASGIAPGDVVTAIDGRPAAEVIAAEQQLTAAATPQFLWYVSLERLLRGPAGSVRLSVARPSGETATVTLDRSLPLQGAGALAERRPAPIAEVAPGVMYLDVQRATDDDFNAALDRLAKARAIVIDFRGYPTMSPIFLQHMVGETFHSARWRIPVATRPDRQGVTYAESAWTLQPLAPRLTARLVFVTDGRAVSYAESCMEIVEHLRLGEIVGGPTAGTNGNFNPFTLPGGFRIFWTGMRVEKQDGSRHHGVGIQPTIPVAPTRQGIAAGHDELLERAIQVASQSPPPQPPHPQP